MPKVIHVEALEGWKLKVQFSDGVHGVISMSGRLFGPVFEPLKDWTLFCKVQVDEFGAVCWPNGADLAPDALYEQINSIIRVA